MAAVAHPAARPGVTDLRAAERLPTPRAGAHDDDAISLVEAALRDDRVTVHFQPLVPLDAAAPVTVEALVRLDLHDHLMQPDAFLPAIAGTPLACLLGRRVLEIAFLELSRWRDEHAGDGPAPRLSVNVSVGQLDGTLPPLVQSLLTSYDLPGESLVIEVTEAGALDPKSGQDLAQLRRLGVRISIDDYGSGMSHLARLREFTFDQIKTDRSLLADAAGNPTATALDAAVLASVVDLAKALHVEVVIEGVETHDQFRLVRMLGADYAQGFLFARPNPACDVQPAQHRGPRNFTRAV